VFTVKEISTTNSGGALLQMKIYVEAGFGTNQPSSMGLTMNPMTEAPKFGAGKHVTTLTFAPKSATSYLWIESPPILCEEKENIADDFHIAVFRSNGQRLGSSGHSFSHEGWNPQPGLVTLRVWCKSWGTAEEDLKVRIYTSGADQSNYYFNHVDSSQNTNPPLTFTVTEVEV
jgi:hypothetical protein